MVARGVGCGHVPPRCEPDEQDAGDHKGPPNPSSAALAPTDVDGLVLWLMPDGRPRGLPNTHQPKPGSQAQGRMIRSGAGCGHVPPRCEPEEQDAGDHKGA